MSKTYNIFGVFSAFLAVFIVIFAVAQPAMLLKFVSDPADILVVVALIALFSLVAAFTFNKKPKFAVVIGISLIVIYSVLQMMLSVSSEGVSTIIGFVIPWEIAFCVIALVIGAFGRFIIDKFVGRRVVSQDQ